MKKIKPDTVVLKDKDAERIALAILRRVRESKYRPVNDLAEANENFPALKKRVENVLKQWSTPLDLYRYVIESQAMYFERGVRGTYPPKSEEPFSLGTMAYQAFDDRVKNIYTAKLWQYDIYRIMIQMLKRPKNKTIKQYVKRLSKGIEKLENMRAKPILFGTYTFDDLSLVMPSRLNDWDCFTLLYYDKSDNQPHCIHFRGNGERLSELYDEAVLDPRQIDAFAQFVNNHVKEEKSKEKSNV